MGHASDARVVSTMLGLAYDVRVPREDLADMERAARRLGLPLAAIEHLGQSAERCRAFTAAARAGDRRAIAALCSVAPEQVAWVAAHGDRPLLRAAPVGA